MNKLDELLEKSRTSYTNAPTQMEIFEEIAKEIRYLINENSVLRKAITQLQDMQSGKPSIGLDNGGRALTTTEVMEGAKERADSCIYVSGFERKPNRTEFSQVSDPDHWSLPKSSCDPFGQSVLSDFSGPGPTRTKTGIEALFEQLPYTDRERIRRDYETLAQPSIWPTVINGWYGAGRKIDDE